MAKEIEELEKTESRERKVTTGRILRELAGLQVLTVWIKDEENNEETLILKVFRKGSEDYELFNMKIGCEKQESNPQNLWVRFSGHDTNFSQCLDFTL